MGRLTRAAVASVLMALAVTSLSGTGAWAQPSQPPTAVTNVKAINAGDLANSFGWNTHWNYRGGVYDRFDELHPMIRQLGVSRLRDGLEGIDDPRIMAQYKAMCADGVRFTFSIRWESDLDALGGHLKELGVPCINAVTGINEPNHFPPSDGGDWVSRSLDAQRRLFDLINADPALADIPVWTMSPTGERERLGDVTGMADACDVHSYASYYGLTVGNPISIYPSLENWEGFCRDLPNVSSEVGIDTGDTGQSSELGQARMMPKAVISYHNAGLRQHHNYELVDEGTDRSDIEDNFGVIRHDLSPKPAFHTMSRLAAVLKDSGQAFTPGSLGFAVTGDTAEVETLLTQRSDGTFVLFVQSNEPVWNHETRQDLAPPTKQVTLALAEAAPVTVHSMGEEQPLATSSGTEVPLSVGADLLAVEIGSAGTPPTAPPPTAPADPPTPAAPPALPAPVAPTAPGENDGNWFDLVVDRLRGLADRLVALLFTDG